MDITKKIQNTWGYMYGRYVTIPSDKEITNTVYLRTCIRELTNSHENFQYFLVLKTQNKKNTK